MTDERDAGIQALFDSASRVGEDDAFIARAMAEIDGTRRRTVIGWIIFGVIMAPVAWWLSEPIMSTIDLAAQLLPDRLVTLERAWVAQFLAPVNSAGGVVGILFLAGWAFYRKLFS